MLLLGFVGLTLLALCFVGLPWLLSRRATSARQATASREVMMQAMYQARLAEVGNEASSGADMQPSASPAEDATSTALQDELKDELGHVYLAEAQALTGVQPAGHSPADEVRLQPKAWVVLTLVVLLPLAAVGVYRHVADVGLEQIRGAEMVLDMPAEPVEPIQMWRDRLQTRVRQAPQDSKSYYLLAHTELKLGEYAAAAEAFAKTNQLVPDDLSVQVYWLQARYLAASGVLDTVSRRLAEDILRASPNVPVVLEILALDAVRQGQAPAAVQYLHRALTSTDNLAQQASFVAAISELRKRFQLPGLTVKVEAMDPVPDGATVFVIARPKGGGMPYAVVKRPSLLLPMDVRLDDLVAMSEGRLLSQAPELEVLVRLSLSGQPMAQPGDWQWQSETLSGATLTQQALALEAELRLPEVP